MTTRRGKIARLPVEVRAELNKRLQNGERMARLVDWLNGLPQVQAMLRSYFEGVPIRQQNVSEWKHGGYVEWQGDLEAQGVVREMHLSAKGLAQAAEGESISDSFATLLVTKLTGLARMLLDRESDPEKQWERLCEVHKQLSRFRRDDHWGVQATVRREKWARETKQEAEQEDSPSKWMTPEERQAAMNQIFGRGTDADDEILAAGRRRILTPEVKAWIVWANMGGTTEELYDEEVEEYEDEEEGICGGDGEGV